MSEQGSDFGHSLCFCGAIIQLPPRSYLRLMQSDAGPRGAVSSCGRSSGLDQSYHNNVIYEILTRRNKQQEIEFLETALSTQR